MQTGIPVVWRLIRANLGLNFNLGFFIPLFKRLSLIIFYNYFLFERHPVINCRQITIILTQLWTTRPRALISYLGQDGGNVFEGRSWVRAFLREALISFSLNHEQTWFLFLAWKHLHINNKIIGVLIYSSWP